MTHRDAALVLIGHGSTLNADSSTPTFQHAEAIRRLGLFAEVHECFWKEEPNFRQALNSVRASRIYLVPNFISSGYFTENVIPREFGLTGAITRTDDGRELYYCEPVGLHPSMTKTLLHRAREVVEKSRVPLDDPRRNACLMICGHGTSLNDNSTKIIQQRVEEIRALGLYADCQMALMEQKPFIKDWREHTTRRDVIVVPYFISDGLHSFEDIPVLLGLTENVRTQGVHNPHVEPESGRRLWYATAIGTESMIADVIVAQVDKFDAEHALVEGDPAATPAPEIVCEGIQFIGEIVILHVGENGFELRHRYDASMPPAFLRPITDWTTWRTVLRDDAQDRFRPLKAAPNIQRGWRFSLASRADFLLALQYLYPAALAHFQLWQSQQLRVTDYPETASRQTGRYHITRTLAGDDLHQLIEKVCRAGCLKKRLWSPEPDTVAAGTDTLPLLCPEACNYFIECARERIKAT